MEHLIVQTSFGEVMLKQEEPNVCSCYIGTDYDTYVGDIDGTLYDNENALKSRIEKMLN